MRTAVACGRLKLHGNVVVNGAQRPVVAVFDEQPTPLLTGSTVLLGVQEVEEFIQRGEYRLDVMPCHKTEQGEADRYERYMISRQTRESKIFSECESTVLTGS